ncbi:MAG: Arm DNA-binding domain-containing protein [Bacteroidales bacterium]
MIKSTFNVAFFIKRNAQRKDGTVPIVSRITINKQVAQFNTKLHILPSEWNAKLGKAAGQTAPARDLNAVLQNIRASIHTLYHKLTIHEDHVTSDKVKNEFLGLNANNETIISL